MVATGPYAYLANPMQTGTVALLAGLAALAGSWSLLAVTGSAVVFCVALADPHEQARLGRRWPQWDDYHTGCGPGCPGRRRGSRPPPPSTSPAPAGSAPTPSGCCGCFR
ncbi:methyltransferase [Dermatophilaceae bacterium Soc4.6]